MINTYTRKALLFILNFVYHYTHSVFISLSHRLTLLNPCVYNIWVAKYTLRGFPSFLRATHGGGRRNKIMQINGEKEERLGRALDPLRNSIEK